MSDRTGDAAVFFGLSGTGKTTLSADPARMLIGDDEHGWSADGIFNFEGGCYAKTIRLSAEAEPQIFATTRRFGTVLENVVLDADGVARFRRRQPDREHALRLPARLHRQCQPDRARPAIPNNIIMLTADAFGVMPPIARLTPAQAMYHFLSGYTAKVAGTERGVTEPRGDVLDLLRRAVHAAPPFRIWRPAAAADRRARRRLLAGQHRLDRRRLWHRPAHADPRDAGAAGGRARRLARPRATFRTDPNFGFAVPVSVPGVGADVVDPAILDPRETWADKAAYDRQAKRLVGMFTANFATLRSAMSTRR